MASCDSKRADNVECRIDKLNIYMTTTKKEEIYLVRLVTLLLKYPEVEVCSLQETEQLRHLNPKDNIGIMVGTNMESLYDYDEAGSTDNRLVLKVSWAYLHLGPLDRVLTIFPLIPVHSLIADLAIKIPTIQVGVKAGCIPPGASVSYRTIS